MSDAGASVSRRALLLAAGMGERLRPLTLKVPKCLLPVGGRPLLDHWLAACAEAGVGRAVVNTHHLAGQVGAYLRARRPPPAITVSHEPELLGSAGALARNRELFRHGGPFAIICSDLFAPGLSLRRMFEEHASSGALLTMAVFRTPQPRHCGIVELSSGGQILSFQEKPEHPLTDLANAGVCIAEEALLDLLPERLPADLGTDLFPRLAGRMFGVLVPEPVIDIGTPAGYRAALDAARARRSGRLSEGGSRPEPDRPPLVL